MTREQYSYKDWKRDIKFWHYLQYENLGSCLIHAYRCADVKNRTALARGFPVFVNAMEDYLRLGEAFFDDSRH